MNLIYGVCIRECVIMCACVCVVQHNAYLHTQFIYLVCGAFPIGTFEPGLLFHIL